MKSVFALLIIIATIDTSYSQSYPWQQRVEYTMDINLDVETHKMKGQQQLIYHNNSPDTLHDVYYHLYFNAFQPGSMMDVRSRTIVDPDPRVMDRIAKLKQDERGYHHILSLKQDGKDVRYTVYGTVMKVTLDNALMPQKKTVLTMQFESQVPLQIRRSGRDNKEGIAYSMTQWYPKMAEYDRQGWHAYPYIGREFFGVWGDYDVTISIDAKFAVAGTGSLQNPNQTGYGYEDEGVQLQKRKQGSTTWHFVAHNVHDFAWAADPEYKHTRIQVPNGPMVHFFYQPSDSTSKNWKALETYTVKHFQYMNEHYGQYLYPSYSVIQGGDGGMEYPMCTLITGKRSLPSLVGVTVHEITHSWYQGALASNESLYPWMDEGFTSFVSGESMNRLFNRQNDPYQRSYQNYFTLVKSGKQEPLSMHADHYGTNSAYLVGAYSMGAIFLQQLKYLIGNTAFSRGMKRYYNTWKMRHPDPNDFIRIMEKESGLQLHWFLRYWIYSTKHIDYAIEEIIPVEEGKSRIMLKRIGAFPMPIDLLITYQDGSKARFYIPLSEMMGIKPADEGELEPTILKPWNWVDPQYYFHVDKAISSIESITIDPLQRMADIDRSNNKLSIDK